MIRHGFLLTLTLLAIGVRVFADEGRDLQKCVLTRPQALFSLSYGEQPSEVGLYLPGPEEGMASGPSDFAVAQDGTVYIGDERNGKVKRFSRAGQLMMATEDRIDRIAAMAVDRQGRIYVIHGVASNQVAVYSQAGGRLPEMEKKIEAALEQLAAREPSLKSGSRTPGAGKIEIDGTGNICLSSGRGAFKVRSNLAEAWLAKGNPLACETEYSYLPTPPQCKERHFVYGADGSLLNEYTDGVLRRAAITVYAADGSIVRTFTLPKGDFGEAEKVVPVGGCDAISDARGHFYTRRSPLAIRHISLSSNPTFFNKSYCAVFEYDEDGNLVGARAVFDSPSAMPSKDWIKVDAAGNVYWLDFKQDGIDVMMAPVPAKP